MRSSDIKYEKMKNVLLSFKMKRSWSNIIFSFSVWYVVSKVCASLLYTSSWNLCGERVNFSLLNCKLRVMS